MAKITEKRKKAVLNWMNAAVKNSAKAKKKSTATFKRTVAAKRKVTARLKKYK